LPTGWHWYKDLTDEQRSPYGDMIEIEIYLSPPDCKQLVKGLTRLGIKNPEQLRKCYLALSEAEDN